MATNNIPMQGSSREPFGCGESPIRNSDIIHGDAHSNGSPVLGETTFDVSQIDRSNRSTQMNELLNASTDNDEREIIREKQMLERHCRSLQKSVEDSEMDRAQLERQVERLRERNGNLESLLNDREKEVDKFRRKDSEQKRSVLAEKDITFDVHREDIQRLTAEHDRVIKHMKQSHERELQAKNEGLANARDILVWHDATDGSTGNRLIPRHRNTEPLALEDAMRCMLWEERQRRDRDRDDLMSYLDRKFDRNVENMKEVVESGVTGAVNKSGAEVGNQVQSLWQESRVNQQMLTAAITGCHMEVSKVQRSADSLAQHAHGTHDAMMERVASLGEEFGRRIEEVKGVLSIKCSEQNQQLQQTIQHLDQSVSNSLASRIQDGDRKQVEMQAAVDSIATSIDGKLKEIKEWVSNLNFNSEKTRTMKLCRI